MASEFTYEDAGKLIILALNAGHAIFAMGVSLFGIIFLFSEGPVIGFILGLVLLLVSWMYLKPAKKEGLMYAFIINIITIPVWIIYIPFPIWVYTVTFAIMVIIFMLPPQFRAKFI
ncbi:MAG: hypothetical protein JW779_09245 [Candidatus Thorarchaeota archaeon]|nr:hypothetical protein [Candidatus Thorarchaeota archaeon]